MHMCSNSGHWVAQITLHNWTNTIAQIHLYNYTNSFLQLQKYICTIAQVHLHNCTNMCALQCCRPRLTRWQYQLCTQAFLHLQYFEREDICFRSWASSCALSSWRRRLGSGRWCAAWSRWASPWGWSSRRPCRRAARSSPTCSKSGWRLSPTGREGWAGGGEDF